MYNINVQNVFNLIGLSWPSSITTCYNFLLEIVECNCANNGKRLLCVLICTSGLRKSSWRDLDPTKHIRPPRPIYTMALVFLTRNTCMQQPLAYIPQTLFQHEVFVVTPTLNLWLNAGSRCSRHVSQYDNCFFNFLYKPAKNRWNLNTFKINTELSISKIYKVGILFWFVCWLYFNVKFRTKLNELKLPAFCRY